MNAPVPEGMFAMTTLNNEVNNIEAILVPKPFVHMYIYIYVFETRGHLYTLHAIISWPSVVYD